MKLTCKTCRTPIPLEAVNFTEGICFCARCNEWFKIASFLAESDTVARIEKPAGSKVGFVADNDSLGLIIPAGRNKGTGILFLIFSLFWNICTWLIIGAAFFKGSKLSNFLFMIPFALMGAGGMLVALYILYGEFSLLLDRETCQAKWSLFKRSYRKIYPTKEITAVRETVDVQNDYGPVYRVGIVCGKKTLKFGFGLSAVERKWIMGEIRHFLKL